MIVRDRAAWAVERENPGKTGVFFICLVLKKVDYKINKNGREAALAVYVEPAEKV
jgi:hypothetical protein